MIYAPYEKSLGQIAFEAFAKKFEARPVWYDLPYQTQTHWEDIAKAVHIAVIKQQVHGYFNP